MEIRLFKPMGGGYEDPAFQAVPGLLEEQPEGLDFHNRG
jgi:hypothetical protein